MSPSPAGPQPRERRAAAILVALLTLAALGLRLVGIGHSLPQRPDDDSVAVGQAQVLRKVWAREDAGPPHPIYYPLLLASTAAALGVCEPVDLGPAPAPLRAHLAAASRPYLSMRLLVVVLSSACIPGMFLLARRVLAQAPSLIAAAVVATSLLHVDFSQQARPHAPAVTFAVFALAAILWAHERPSVRRFALAGFLAGLSAGTLQTGAAVVLTLGVALLSGLRHKRPHAWTEVLVAGALCAALTLLFYFHPYPREGAATFSYQPGKLMISGHPAEFALFNGQGFVKLGRFLLSYDPVLCALAVLGAARLASRARQPRQRGAQVGNAALLAAHAVPYLAVFGMFSWISDRFALPLLPHLALLSAVGIEGLANLLPRALAPSANMRLGMAATVALALPTAAAVSYVAQHTRPETGEQAARYIEQHLSPSDDLLFLSARITLPLALHPPEGEPWPTSQWFAWESYLKQRSARASDSPTWTVHRITTLEDPKRNGPAEPLRAAGEWPAARRWALLVTPEHGEPDPARRALEALGAAEIAVFGPQRIERAGRLDAEEQGLRSRFARAFLDSCPGPRLSLLRW
jgi:Dolichyl-phosphate-mannose-protein mannosyltransferase